MAIVGESLVKSAVLTSKAFNKGFFGDYGEYIVTLGLLLFAFSTVVSKGLTTEIDEEFIYSVKSTFFCIGLFICRFFIVGTGWLIQK